MIRPRPLPLREYQTEIIGGVRTALRTYRRVLLQSPTGSGKTVITAHMIRSAAERAMSSVFLVHRKELVEQTSGALWALGVQHGVIAGGRTLTADMVQVATVQTLVRRVSKIRAPRFVIIDEAHHAAAASYRKVLEAWPDAYVVGLTATPARTDGRGLDDLFDALVPGPTVPWLMEQGYLAQYRAYAPGTPGPDLTGIHTRAGDYVTSELEAVVDQSAIVGDAVDHYRRLVHPRTCLVYCVSRKHARHVEEAYRSAGIDARYCGGDTDQAERRRIVAGLRSGTPPVVVSVDLFGEGLDAPGLAAVQLLRPTQSLGLHLQQLGRVLRPEEGKAHAVILDHVGNIARHGFPDDEREWTLEGNRKRRGKADESGPSLRHCNECFMVYRAALQRCPGCGAGATLSRRVGPEVVDGQLEELDPKAIRAERKREEGQARTLEDLVALAKARGYRASWAGFRWASRTKMPQGKAIAAAQKLWRESA